MKAASILLLALVGVAAATNLRQGACATPSKVGDRLQMDYTGTLTNGKQFDSSVGRAPFEFTLGAGEVIKGWDKGLQGMCPGEERDLTIPPEDGYGEQGAGEDIPPGATLKFHVKLLGIQGQ